MTPTKVVTSTIMSSSPVFSEFKTQGNFRSTNPILFLFIGNFISSICDSSPQLHILHLVFHNYYICPFFFIELIQKEPIINIFNSKFLVFLLPLIFIFYLRPVTSQSQASKSEGSEADVEKFRRKLKERGGTGILGLGRQFRVPLFFFPIVLFFH